MFRRRPSVAVIRLEGVIGSGPSKRIGDESMRPVLERAFRKGKPVAIALEINSPGGSPVQSSLVAARIRRMAEKAGLPVHAFVEDVAASGGYWLAATADDIWVDESSVIGSIGVIHAGFGAHGFIERQGFERRIHTAGESKSQLDPFMPERAEDVERLRTLLERIHENFKAHVRQRRGGRLREEDGASLFSGEFWLGARAVELGLADGIGQIDEKLKDLYGDRVRLIRHGRRRGLLQRMGAALAGDAIAAAEERIAYARYGA